MYYLAKLRFETETDDGKKKNVREQYLVDASSISEAETILMERFGDGMSSCVLESVQESKILGLIEKN